MSTILIIGDVRSESQYFVPKIPLENEFVISSDVSSGVGSKSINAARIFSRLENQVLFYAHVGDDVEGKNAKFAFQKWSFTPELKVIEGQKTGKLVLLTNPEGKSAISFFPGANATIKISNIHDLKDTIKKTDGVYTTTNLDLESLYFLSCFCKEFNIPLFLDVPSQHTQLNLAKLDDVTFFAPNRQEAGLLLNRSIGSIEEAKLAALELRKSVKGIIVITLDKDGCIILDQNSEDLKHFETTPQVGVDETAAGDIFRSVLFDSYLKKKSLESSIEKALLIATCSTLIKGVDETLNKVELNQSELD